MSVRVLSASVLSLALLVAAGASPALARSHGGRPGSGSSPTGNDISWPQCGGAYPTGQAFGIVGLNDGLANNLNPCLASELTWAAASSGATKLPRASIYVNTANPGQVVPAVADWPADNVDPGGVSEAPGSPNADPYGTCTGDDDAACSWQYGWDRAVADLLWLAGMPEGAFSTRPSDYPWWLDVETGNSWETGSNGLSHNIADLEGMVTAMRDIGGIGTVGIYSTTYQWDTITGGTEGSAVLANMPDWIPGARKQSGAQSNCGLPPFTGGPVLVTQWFGRFDGDVSCAG